MEIKLSLDEHMLTRARGRAKALGRTLDDLIREFLAEFAIQQNAARWMEEFKSVSGRGNSRGWSWNREEIHTRR